ncbi:MAG: hypothetical protein ACRDK7_14995 [Solirubrobacteraceae bacterium]
MELLIAIIALALLVVVILVISAPLRADRRSHDPARAPRDLVSVESRAELETAREAKYREIRDTELDYRTGKLSREDFAATDGALRAEALEILDRLEALEGNEDED